MSQYKTFNHIIHLHTNITLISVKVFTHACLHGAKIWRDVTQPRNDGGKFAMTVLKNDAIVMPMLSLFVSEITLLRSKAQYCAAAAIIMKPLFI